MLALIVERDPGRAEFYRAIVAAFGLEVVIALDAGAARRTLADRGAPKLVLADLGLLQSEGFSLLRELRDSSPEAPPAVVAQVSDALRTTASDLQDLLGIAELLPPNADARVTSLAVKRALGEAHFAAVTSNPPSSAVSHPESRVARIGDISLLDEDSTDEMLRQLLSDAVEILHAPIALVSLALEDKHWFRTHVGSTGNLLPDGGLPWDSSLCAYVVEAGEPVLVPDAAAHPLFASQPSVRRGVLRGYAGAPLTTSAGEVLGALCILDSKPFTMNAKRIDMLTRLARRVSGELELRSKARMGVLEVVRLNEKLADEREKNRAARATATYMQAILAELEEGVALVDDTGCILYVNAALASFVGQRQVDLVGKRRGDLLQALAELSGQPEEVVRALSPSSDGQVASSREFQLEKPYLRLLRWSVKPLALEERRAELAIVSDISAIAVAERRPGGADPESAVHRVLGKERSSKIGGE